MTSDNRQDFKQLYLKDFKTAVYTISALLIVVLGVVLLATVDRFGWGWIKPVVVFLFILILFMLNTRWPLAVKLFKLLRLNLLFPPIDEMIKNHERWEQNQVVVKRMESTLTFYNLWPHIDVTLCPPHKQRQERGRLAQWFHNLRARLQKEKPKQEAPQFGQVVFKKMHLVDDEDERIADCSARTVECRIPTADHISPNLLNLLYRERNGLEILPFDDESAKKLKPDLERVLRESGRLPAELVPLQTPVAGNGRVPCCYQGNLVDLASPLETYKFWRVHKNLLDRREKNHLVVGKMRQTLNFYRMPPLDSPLFDRLVNSVPAKDDENDRITHCAGNIAACLQKEKRPPSARLIELLYRERNDEPFPFYDDQTEEETAVELAQALRSSNRLPKELIKPSPDLPITHNGDFQTGYQGQLETLVKPLETYRFRHVEIELDELRKKNHLVADRMNQVLIYYKIGKLEPPIHQLLINSVPIADVEDERIQNCAQNVAAHLQTIQTPRSANLIELLYRERNRVPNTTLELDSELVAELAEVLCQCQRLPAQENLPYEIDDIELILQNTADFSLDRVIDKLVDYQTNRREDKLVIANMLQTLVLYNLVRFLAPDKLHQSEETNGVELTESFEKILAEPLFATRTQDDRIKACAKQFVKHLDDNEKTVTAPLLDLLYRERYILTDLSIKRYLIPKVAAVLFQSDLLPEQEADLPYTQKDVAFVLRRLTKFKLGKVVDALNLRLTKRRENRSVVDAMIRALTYYKMFPFLEQNWQKDTRDKPVLEPEFRRELINALPRQDDEDGRIMNCARNIKRHCAADSPIISDAILELIYRDFHGLETAVVWESRSKKMVTGAATILISSGCLPEPDDNLPYQQSDLETLLQKLEAFSLRLIQEELDSLSQLWHLASEYHRFLIRNGVENWDFKLEEALAHFDKKLGGLPGNKNELKIFDKQAQAILVWIGKNAINNTESKPAGSLLESFCLISLAIFLSKFERRPKMLAAICKKAAKKEDACLVALAYIEFRSDLDSDKELDGRPFVSIDYLIKNWEARVREKREELPDSGFKKEISTIQKTLEKGSWLTRLWRMLELTWVDLREENKQLKDFVAQSETARQVIGRFFEETVSTNTLVRFLEARMISAYLMAFESRKGSLAKLIDCLMLRPIPVSQSRSGKFTQAELRIKEKVRLMTDEHNIVLQDKKSGQWIYHFAHYTDNTRIGIVPIGWTLEEFFKVFDRDIRELTDNTTLAEKQLLVPDHVWVKEEEDGGANNVETHPGVAYHKDEDDEPPKIDILDKTEIILHRFGVKSHYVVPLASRSETAVRNMNILFQRKLQDDDIVSALVYEGQDKVKIGEALQAGTIADFVTRKIPLEARVILALEEEDMTLKRMLLNEMKCPRIQKLGEKIVEDNKVREQAEESLEKILDSHLPMLSAQDGLARDIAENYFATLSEFTDAVSKLKPSTN